MNQLTITPTHYDAGTAESEETLQFQQLKVEFIKRVSSSNESAFVFEKISSDLSLKKVTPLGRLFYGLLRQKPPETTQRSYGINKPSPKRLNTLPYLPDGYEDEIQNYLTRFNHIALQLGLSRAHFTGNPMHEMAPDLREGELINSFITRLRETLRHPQDKATSVSKTRASINAKDDSVSTQPAQKQSQSINKAVSANRLNLKIARSLFAPKNTPLTLGQYLNNHCTSRSERLDQLQRFVNEVVANNDQPFVPCLGLNHKKHYAPSRLAKQHFHKLLEYIWILSILPQRFIYSEAINCLRRCCQAMHFMAFVDKPLSDLNYWASPMKIPRGLKAPTADLFNKLIFRIRADWKSNHCQAKVNKRLGELDELYREYCQYTDVLFDDCARLLVLRIDLFYDKQYANTKTLPDIQKDLSHFIDNKRHNKIFNSLKGHIAKIEYGIDKGIHCHLLLFLDGFQRKNSSAVHFVKQLGEYWKTTITQGVGRYWNINRNARQYEKSGRLGIGVINYHDTDLRTNLKEYVIRYLCKPDQFIRPQFGDSIKLLRRGNPPKKTGNKLGRPRKLCRKNPIEEQKQALSVNQN